MITKPLPSLRDLTLEQKIAQILIEGYPATLPLTPQSPKQVESFIQRYGIGSIHLKGGDLNQTRQWASRLQELAAQACGIPITMAADCEQGLPHSFAYGTELPWQMAMGAAGNTQWAFEAGAMLGVECQHAGIDMVYGPVADVNTNKKNQVIMTRAFGASPEKVAGFTDAYVRGLQSKGVIATLKHFPGHGQAEEDSHMAAPVDDSSRQSMEENHLVPFRAGFAAGAGSVMTGHVIYPSFDAAHFATLSQPVLTDLLRQNMQFKGVVITDSLRMRAITRHTGKSVVESAFDAFNAGADMLMHPGNLFLVLDAFKEMIKNGNISEHRLNQAVERILAMKQWTLSHRSPFPYKSGDWDQAAHLEIAEKIAEASITLITREPVVPLIGQPIELVQVIDNGNKCVSPDNTFQDLMTESSKYVNRFDIFEHTHRNKIEAVKSHINTSANPVILSILCPMFWGKGRTLLPENLQSKLRLLFKDRFADCIVCFGSPLILDELSGNTKICAYGPSKASQRAAARVLLGQLTPSGTLPVLV